MTDNEDRTPGADRAPSNTTPDAARLTAAIDQFLWPKYLNGADGPARSWQFYQDLKWLGEHVAALLTAESENAWLTAALDRVRTDDAERWRYIRTMLDTGTEPADDGDGSLDYVAVDTIALKDATARLGEYQTVEQLVDAARTQPEGSND